jgi:hypothetical protein
MHLTTKIIKEDFLPIRQFVEHHVRAGRVGGWRWRRQRRNVCWRRRRRVLHTLRTRLVGTRCGRQALRAVAFLLVGGTIGLICVATYVAAVLVCRFERGGMKRARAAAELLPTSAAPLGFGACGGAPMAAAAGEIE